MLTTLDVWNQFSGQLHNFIRKRVSDPRDADDIMQDVFVKLHTRIETLRDEDRVASWVYQIARNALIAADWPEDVTGFTVNRFCGSGLEAVNSIAAKIGAGFIDGGIGGGVESMSRVPMGSDEAMIDGLNLKLRKRLFMVPQGISADLIATRERFTREDVDRFAAESQARCARAQKEGRFARSLIPVHDASGALVLDRDEHPRASTTLDSLAKLEPSFTGMGAYTPKNDTRRGKPGKPAASTAEGSAVRKAESRAARWTEPWRSANAHQSSGCHRSSAPSVRSAAESPRSQASTISGR